ncbi:DUF2851 family protein [bacterium]|nr:DUF2851 family protein [bacterium]
MVKKSLAERFICHIWDGCHLKKRSLYTQSGKKVKVNFPGMWNTYEGPDFKNAKIEIGNQEFEGDVEVHLHTRAWYSHKHDEDENYNNVILHVVMWGDNSTFIEREDRLKVEILEVNNLLDSSINKLFTEYKLEKMEVQTKNCPIIPKKLELLQILEECGEIRFLEKVERFRKLTKKQSFEQTLYKGILEALGYTKNTSAFSKLADILPVEILRKAVVNLSLKKRILGLQGIMFGAAGLLPSQSGQIDFPLGDRQDLYITGLEKTWKKFSANFSETPMKSEDWHFFRVRPINQPTKRIAGVCHFLGKTINKGILNSLINAFFETIPKSDKLKELFTELAFEDYWTSHFNFWGKEQKSHATLIGENRTRTIIVNTVLPILFLFFDSENNESDANNILLFYKKYHPLPENNITRLLKRRIFTSVPEASKYIDSVSKQQGLIYLYKKHCTAGDCRNCPITK